MSRQKELDSYPKSYHQIGFAGQLDSNTNATDAGDHQSMFVLTILEIIKEMQLKFSQRSVMVK